MGLCRLGMGLSKIEQADFVVDKYEYKQTLPCMGGGMA